MRTVIPLTARSVAVPGRRLYPRIALLAAALVVAATVTACTGAGATPSMTTLPAVTPAPLGQRDTVYHPPRPAPALQLTDQDGQPFDLASLRGTPVLVYFGYTHCPDICPTTLADLRDALRLVATPVQVVFVTIDPARDDAAAMKQYVDFYQAGFIGLTGSDAQIAAAAAAWASRTRSSPRTRPAATPWPTPPTSTWWGQMGSFATTSSSARVPSLSPS